MLFVIENGYFVPMVRILQQSTLVIRYFAFGGYAEKNLQFFYNCPDNGCKSFFTNRYVYDTYFPVDRAQGYKVYMRFYVKGNREAQVLFTPEKNSKRGYEFGEFRTRAHTHTHLAKDCFMRLDYLLFILFFG